MVVLARGKRGGRGGAKTIEDCKKRARSCYYCGGKGRYKKYVPRIIASLYWAQVVPVTYSKNTVADFCFWNATESSGQSTYF
jgi:hypothetical protein